MNSLSLNHPALASPEAVSAAADSFWQIADALHLSLRAISEQLGVTTVEAYALITEEYGLRTRLGFLRGDAVNRVVADVGISQQDFLDLLSSAATFIRHSRSVDQIASVVNTVSVLCVSIFPGKNGTVNFLLDQLRAEVHR